jgi:hypothetical protein
MARKNKNKENKENQLNQIDLIDNTEIMFEDYESTTLNGVDISTDTFGGNDIVGGDITGGDISGGAITGGAPIVSKPANKKKKPSSNSQNNKKPPQKRTSMQNNFDKDSDLTKPQRCQKYNPKCTSTRYWQITIISTILMIGIGLGYQLSIPFIILIAISGFFMTQNCILYICRNKYENQKIEDVGSYIEQMLYSFRRNYKILSSLEDTIDVFEEGEMRSCIQAAIDYILQASSTGNIYEEALSIIEAEFDCRRMRSLHRFLVKVEGVGGDNEIGIQALLNNRRMWLERMDEFKKEKSSVVKEIIVSCAFSSVICAITMYMLPSYVGSMKHIVCRIGSTIYILLNQLTITQAFKRTVLFLNDTYTPEEEEEQLQKLRRYKTWDKKSEQKKQVMPAVAMVGLGLAALFFDFFMDGMSIWWICPIFILMAAFAYFAQPIMRYNSIRKVVTQEISKAYPDWLLELSLLLQTENLHVALEKTLETAPKILSDDLIELGDNIISYPTEIFPYSSFLRHINVPNIHSSMKLLYSIATYGTQEEEKQISELIERNASLMDKAEEVKNTERLSRVYILKFFPMGASALKLIVDMFVFIILFISQSLSSVAM